MKTPINREYCKYEQSPSDTLRIPENKPKYKSQLANRPGKFNQVNKWIAITSGESRNENRVLLLPPALHTLEKLKPIYC